MAFCDPAIFLSRIMKNGDQAITVLANVEDHIAIDIVGILEDLQDFHEIPPFCSLGNFAPGCDLFGGFWILLCGAIQVLFSNNVHEDALSSLECCLENTFQNENWMSGRYGLMSRFASNSAML